MLSLASKNALSSHPQKFRGGRSSARPQIPPARSVELHCGSPLEQPKDDANRNQANETAITKLLDNRYQISNDVSCDKADHSTKKNLKQDPNSY